MRSMRSSDGTARLAVGLAVLVLLALGIAAYFLASTQAEQRRDLRERYADRPAVAAALLDSLFAMAAANSAADAAARFRDRRISRAALDEEASDRDTRWVAVVDDRRRAIGASSGAPTDDLRRLERSSRAVRSALSPRDFGLSSTRDGLIEFAVGFETPAGRRVQVEVSPMETFGTLLDGTLRPLPGMRAARAYVLDDAGVVLGAVQHGGGRPRPRPALIEGSARRRVGLFSADDGERFFAVAPLPRSTWRVVSTVRTDVLYASVSGMSRVLPWLIFGGVVGLLLAAALLLRRLLCTTAQLRRANAELERSNADLEQFAYAASHDLSEPLRTVAGFSQLLSRRYGGRLDEEADLYIEHMGAGVDRMQQLIDDLLLYSRMSRMPATRRAVDLDELLSEVLQDIDPAIRERGAEITCDPLPRVFGERAQLGQVLQNLLLNAIKFTAPEVTPRIRVCAVRDGGGWRVIVRDNGIGVEGRQREAIWRMFGRLHSSDAYPGTGIGLALVKRIVERHGGIVRVEPAPGGGSAFSFTVPGRVVAADPATPPQEVPA